MYSGKRPYTINLGVAEYDVDRELYLEFMEIEKADCSTEKRNAFLDKLNKIYGKDL